MPNTSPTYEGWNQRIDNILECLYEYCFNQKHTHYIFKSRYLSNMEQCQFPPRSVQHILRRLIDKGIVEIYHSNSHGKIYRISKDKNQLLLIINQRRQVVI